MRSGWNHHFRKHDCEEGLSGQDPDHLHIALHWPQIGRALPIGALPIGYLDAPIEKLENHPLQAQFQIHSIRMWGHGTGVSLRQCVLHWVKGNKCLGWGFRDVFHGSREASAKQVNPDVLLGEPGRGGLPWF